MVKKIVEFTSLSSNRQYDGRVNKRQLYASIDKVNYMDTLYMTIRDKSDKIIFTTSLKDWASVMALFDEMVISVAAKSLEELFPDA